MKYAKYTIETPIGGLPFNEKYWPHQMFIENWSKAYDAERWCYENFKGRNWKSIGRHFVFKRGVDATIFSLRWL